LGLSRLLMERIMENWGAACDLMYLYANDSVRGFYLAALLLRFITTYVTTSLFLQ